MIGVKALRKLVEKDVVAAVESAQGKLGWRLVKEKDTGQEAEFAWADDKTTVYQDDEDGERLEVDFRLRVEVVDIRCCC